MRRLREGARAFYAGGMEGVNPWIPVVKDNTAIARPPVRQWHCASLVVLIILQILFFRI